MTLRTREREVACRVPEAVLLLVGGIVFLVDDDQAGPRERREHG